MNNVALTEARALIRSVPPPQCGRIHLFATTVGRHYFESQGWRLYGLDNIPLTGPAIVVPNHVHILDPGVVGCALPRSAYSMAKAELFKVLPEGAVDSDNFDRLFARYLGGLLPYLGGFPVIRGSWDRNALTIAGDLLKQGNIVIMFPEGGISPDVKELRLAKEGAALLGWKYQVPLVPVYLRGTGAQWEGYPEYKGPIEVHIGSPLWPETVGFPSREMDRRQAQHDLTDLLWKEMHQLGLAAWQ